jgi:hypothetical protein
VSAPRGQAARVIATGKSQTTGGYSTWRLISSLTVEAEALSRKAHFIILPITTETHPCARPAS